MKINANSDLPVFLGNRDDIGYPIRVFFFPEETKIYKLLNFRLDCFYYLRAELSLLLLDELCVWINVEAMHSHLRVKHGHILIFQVKTSIYSRTRHMRSSFSGGDKLSLMKMGLGLASSPRLI